MTLTSKQRAYLKGLAILIGNDPRQQAQNQNPDKAD